MTYLTRKITEGIWFERNNIDLDLDFSISDTIYVVENTSPATNYTLNILGFPNSLLLKNTLTSLQTYSITVYIDTFTNSSPGGYINNINLNGVLFDSNNIYWFNNSLPSATIADRLYKQTFDIISFEPSGTFRILSKLELYG